MQKGYLVFAIFLTMIASSIFVVPAFADDNYIGTNPGLNFYSMIDDGAAKMTDSFVKRDLKERGTYGGLTRTNPCGKNAPWMNSIPIDENLLKEVSNGIYSRLMMLASSKKVSLTSDTLNELGLCLAKSYQDVTSTAYNNQSMLERVGSLGLYMDGDSSNSDYDIVADIEKINSIIFKETEKYKGSVNMARASLASFLAGNPVDSIIPSSTLNRKETTTPEITPTMSADTTTIGTMGASSTAGKSTISSPAISFGDVCKDTSSSITNVDNLIDDAFMEQLASTVSYGKTTVSNAGADYGSTFPMVSISSTASGGSSGSGSAGTTSSSDFFHEIPCDNVLCIKVRMVNGGQNLLGGGQKTSIESIIERHIQILGPIVDSNLAGQKMTNNMYQLNWSNLKFSNIIPKPLIYLAYKPQNSRRDKKNDTPESKDAKLQASFKCAMYSAGLSSNMNMANSILGGTLGVTNASTTNNALNSEKSLGPNEPDQKTLDACFDVALSEGRKSYYDSFSTDITEIGAFTAGMIEEINGILESGKKIDSLPVQ